MRNCYLEQRPRSAAKWDAIVGQTDPAEALYKRLLSDAKFLNKGEFAHALAARIEDNEVFTCPSYIEEAILKTLQSCHVA
jgi:putative ATP-dependent endonuclease of OLD family